MPRKPKKPCKYQRCPNLTEGDYCEEHKKLAQQRYTKFERDPAINKRYGAAWKKIRARYVAAYPLCELCKQEGRLTPVEHVHHIKELSEGGTSDFDNLMSLCKHHHSSIHMTKRNRKG